MSNILIKAFNENILDKYLNEADKEILISKIKALNLKYLYSSPFHGLHHSEKVLLFSYLISKQFKLTTEELEILLDAALYHDIGRENDNEDKTHGMISANKIGLIFQNKGIYQNQAYFSLLQALCDVHSVDDKKSDFVFDYYELNEEYKETFTKLFKILKDADALDRTRFRTTASYALKESFLRFEYSKSLVNMAYQINDYYRDQISEYYYQKYQNIKKGESKLCYHGIGFNFATFESILEHGILSSYGKKKRGIASSRNFNGNNNDLWISVVVGEGEAKETFVDNGISFEIETANLTQGITKKSEALSEGLPINSGRYRDEYFAFFEIPLEQIRAIHVQEEFLKRDVRTLNYFIGSMNYDSLVLNIDSYLAYMRINFNYFPDITNLENLKMEMREIIVNYEKESEKDQIHDQGQFYQAIEQKVSLVNHEFQRSFGELFEKLFGKENVSVNEVVDYILAKRNISLSYKENTYRLKVF